eukprot:10108-Pelagococcus_subviridis.AAC.6
MPTCGNDRSRRIHQRRRRRRRRLRRLLLVFFFGFFGPLSVFLSLPSSSSSRRAREGHMTTHFPPAGTHRRFVSSIAALASSASTLPSLFTSRASLVASAPCERFGRSGGG